MASTVNEGNVAVNHVTERVNLYDFAYEKSGSVKGDPDVYKTYLDRIFNGDLVEESYTGFTDEEKKERIKEIKELEKELKANKTENVKVEEEIKQKEEEIDKNRKELLQRRKNNAKDLDKLKAESFSPVKAFVNFFLLIALSVYLFFFYISAAYKALYVDFEGIAESIAEGSGTGSVMPGAYELAEALQYNYLLLLVPFVFYAFGWAFHIILDMKNKAKFVYIGLLVGVTFLVDFLLALIIHNNTESAKELMGLETVHFSQSSTFYIILFLGFLVYIIWSILIHALSLEWDKRQAARNIKKMIAHLRKDIEELTKKLKDVETLERKINDFRDDVAVVMYGNLKKYIDQFTSGWVSYLSPANMKEVKERCLSIKKDFEDKNDIRKGVVRVINRR